MVTGMKQKPLNLIYDGYAEELFSTIYLGKPQELSFDSVTPLMMASSEIYR